MTLGLYDYERRYRRRLWGAIVRVGFYVVTLTLAALFAYQIGVERTRTAMARMESRLEEMTQANIAAQEHAIAQEGEAHAALRLYEELLGQYEREVPTGVRRELAELVDSRIEAGVDPDRLRFYISSAAAPRNCSAPTSRRFVLPTPANRGAGTPMTFADGRITVTGMGAVARSDSGSPLGWYDPAQEVTITVTIIGGQTASARGLLPLHHSVAVAGNEWRFTILPAERGAVTITSDRCAMP